jgi:hypothetical protein
MDEDGCYVQLYFYDKLSSLRSSDMSDPFMRHVRGTRFGYIRRDPEYAFTPLFIFLSPRVGGNTDDSPAISSLLLPTCKVREEDSSRYQIGPLPIGFVHPLLHRGNSIVFNLVFSFPSFFYIASRLLWSRYSYNATKHRSVKYIWVISRFKRDQYSRIAS